MKRKLHRWNGTQWKQQLLDQGVPEDEASRRAITNRQAAYRKERYKRDKAFRLKEQKRTREYAARKRREHRNLK